MPHLRQLTFRGDSAGPHLLITGGVHGDEFEPMIALRRLADMLSDEQTKYALRGRITLVPCVNEDAFLLGTRCASDGVDLARTCPGRRDGTVTEDTAWALSELIKSADLYIDLHTGGTEFSIFPLAGYMLHTDADVLDTQRQMARAFNLPVVWGTSPQLEGRSLSVARDAGIPAIYCEYHGSATCGIDGVDAYISGCLNVMSTLQMIDRPANPARVEFLIEDDRPDSGHLQVCNPAPVDGLFEPAVQLGQQVSAGQALGTVFALANHAAHSITSQQDGIVLMLRTFPRVRCGDSVGVILETANAESRR